MTTINSPEEDDFLIEDNFKQIKEIVKNAEDSLSKGKSHLQSAQDHFNNDDYFSARDYADSACNAFAAAERYCFDAEKINPLSKNASNWHIQGLGLRQEAMNQRDLAEKIYYQSEQLNQLLEQAQSAEKQANWDLLLYFAEAALQIKDTSKSFKDLQELHLSKKSKKVVVPITTKEKLVTWVADQPSKLFAVFALLVVLAILAAGWYAFKF